MRLILALCIVAIAHSLSFAQLAGFETPKVNLTLNKGFDIAYAYVIGNEPHMFCYDTHTGKAAFWRMSYGNKPLASLSIGNSWNFFCTIRTSQGSPLYLLANSQTGDVKTTLNILDIASKNQVSINNTFDNTQWSTTSVVHLNLEPYLFRYIGTTGEVLLNRIHPQTALIDDTPTSHTIEPQWDHIEFAQSQECIYVLKHSTAKKSIVMECVKHNTASSNPLEATLRLTYETTTEWTSSTIFTFKEMAYLLLYSAMSGEIMLLQANEDMTQLVTLYKTTWSTGWTNFNVIYLNSWPYLFHHKESNGLARLSRIVL